MNIKLSPNYESAFCFASGWLSYFRHMHTNFFNKEWRVTTKKKPKPQHYVMVIRAGVHKKAAPHQKKKRKTKTSITLLYVMRIWQCRRHIFICSVISFGPSYRSFFFFSFLAKKGRKNKWTNEQTRAKKKIVFVLNFHDMSFSKTELSPYGYG